MKQIIPETNFPEQPINRWQNWTGTLGPGDETYIFSKSVFSFLFYILESRLSKYKLNSIDIEELAQNIIWETCQEISKICDKKQKISKSISSLVFFYLYIYIKKNLQQYFQEKEILIPDNFEFFIHDIENESVYIIREEIIKALNHCMNNLQEEVRKIIHCYYFLHMGLKEITKKLKKKMNYIFIRKEKGEKLLYECMKKKGYDKMEDIL